MIEPSAVKKIKIEGFKTLDDLKAELNGVYEELGIGSTKKTNFKDQWDDVKKYLESAKLKEVEPLDGQGHAQDKLKNFLISFKPTEQHEDSFTPVSGDGKMPSIVEMSLIFLLKIQNSEEGLKVKALRCMFEGSQLSSGLSESGTAALESATAAARLNARFNELILSLFPTVDLSSRATVARGSSGALTLSEQITASLKQLIEIGHEWFWDAINKKKCSSNEKVEITIVSSTASPQLSSASGSGSSSSGSSSSSSSSESLSSASTSSSSASDISMTMTAVTPTEAAAPPSTSPIVSSSSSSSASASSSSSFSNHSHSLQSSPLLVPEFKDVVIDMSGLQKEFERKKALLERLQGSKCAPKMAAVSSVVSYLQMLVYVVTAAYELAGNLAPQYLGTTAKDTVKQLLCIGGDIAASNPSCESFKDDQNSYIHGYRNVVLIEILKHLSSAQFATTVTRLLPVVNYVALGIQVINIITQIREKLHARQTANQTVKRMNLSGSLFSLCLVIINAIAGLSLPVDPTLNIKPSDDNLPNCPVIVSNADCAASELSQASNQLIAPVMACSAMAFAFAGANILSRVSNCISSLKKDKGKQLVDVNGRIDAELRRVLGKFEGIVERQAKQSLSGPSVANISTSPASSSDHVDVESAQEDGTFFELTRLVFEGKKLEAKDEHQPQAEGAPGLPAGLSAVKTETWQVCALLGKEKPQNSVRLGPSAPELSPHEMAEKYFDDVLNEVVVRDVKLPLNASVVSADAASHNCSATAELYTANDNKNSSETLETSERDHLLAPTNGRGRVVRCSISPALTISLAVNRGHSYGATESGALSLSVSQDLFSSSNSSSSSSVGSSSPPPSSRGVAATSLTFFASSAASSSSSAVSFVSSTTTSGGSSSSSVNSERVCMMSQPTLNAGS